MSEKCQITPAKVFASCETYNCHKKIAWAVGRPDGPIQLQKFYCDQCMRDILSNIPDGLADCLPVMGVGVVDGYISMSRNRVREITNELQPDSEIRTVLIKELAAVDKEVTAVNKNPKYLPVADKEAIIELYDKLFRQATHEEQTDMVNRLIGIISEDLDLTIDQGPPNPAFGVAPIDDLATQQTDAPAKKKYSCDYCTEQFDTPQQKAGHTRVCKSKKEGETGG